VEFTGKDASALFSVGKDRGSARESWLLDPPDQPADLSVAAGEGR
jgi:hypothetical protein